MPVKISVRYVPDQPLLPEEIREAFVRIYQNEWMEPNLPPDWPKVLPPFETANVGRLRDAVRQIMAMPGQDGKSLAEKNASRLRRRVEP